MLFPEYFCGKCLDQRAPFPRIRGQSSLAAGLLEEGDGVPLTLDRDLGQKKTTASDEGDQQAMAADLDGFGRDAFRRRQDAQFDLQISGLFERNRRKPRVLEGSGPGGVGDRAIDRADGKNIANASAQLAMEVERGKCAARFGEMGRWGIKRNFTTFERRQDGIVGEPQK